MKQTKLVDYYVRLTPSLNSWNTTDKYVSMALRALMSDCKRHLDFEQIDYEMVYEDYCSHCGQIIKLTEYRGDKYAEHILNRIKEICTNALDGR